MAKTVEARVALHHGDGCTCQPLTPIERTFTPVMVSDDCPARVKDPEPVETGRRVIITWPAPTTSGILPIYRVTLADADTGEQIITAVKLSLTLGTDTGFEGDIIEAEVTALVNADGEPLRAGEQAVPTEDGDWLNTKVFRFAVAEMRVAE